MGRIAGIMDAAKTIMAFWQIMAEKFFAVIKSTEIIINIGEIIMAYAKTPFAKIKTIHNELKLQGFIFRQKSAPKGGYKTFAEITGKVFYIPRPLVGPAKVDPFSWGFFIKVVCRFLLRLRWVLGGNYDNAHCRTNGTRKRERFNNKDSQHRPLTPCQAV